MLGWEFPPFKSGGLGTHCLGLTKALSRKNAQITFLMPYTGMEINPGFIKVVQVGKSRTRFGAYAASTVSGSGKKTENVYGSDFFAAVNAFTREAVEAAKLEEFDVIHAQDWMTFPAGVEIKKFSGKPLVVSVHSTEFDRTGNLSPNQWICDIEWKGMFEANRVITVSNYMKEQLATRYSVPREKISVVYNAIEAGQFMNAAQRQFGLDEQIVLFTGRLTVQKGPDFFLDAAAKVLEKNKKARFVIVGSGYMLPQLINKAIDLGISDNVSFVGFQQNIEDYYKLASCYVMPSVSEPFGIGCLEAMCSSVPTIVSSSSGVKEIVKHCFVVDFWDIDEMANKIIGILRYSPLKKEMAKNGLHEAKSINWGKIANDTLNVYSMAGAAN